MSKKSEKLRVQVVITTYKEPKTIGKAIEEFLKQKFDEPWELIVSGSDPETMEIAEKYEAKDKRVRTFWDFGEGKSEALNQLLPELTGEVIILSDGDVHVGKDALANIVKHFEDEKVGCVTGRPVSLESKKEILGYWSHLLCDAGAHEARLRRHKKGKFLECSGYLWAFRNGVLKKFPLDVAEDTVVPHLFAGKGYKVRYAHDSEVYVKFPKTWKDFMKQKIRTAKAHDKIKRYVDVKKTKKTKTFLNEVFEGWTALVYPRNLREVIYTGVLFPARLWMWFLVFWEIKVKKKEYGDGWERVESTK